MVANLCFFIYLTKISKHDQERLHQLGYGWLAMIIPIAAALCVSALLCGYGGKQLEAYVVKNCGDSSDVLPLCPITQTVTIARDELSKKLWYVFHCGERLFSFEKKRGTWALIDNRRNVVAELGMRFSKYIHFVRNEREGNKKLVYRALSANTWPYPSLSFKYMDLVSLYVWGKESQYLERHHRIDGQQMLTRERIAKVERLDYTKFRLSFDQKKIDPQLVVCTAFAAILTLWKNHKMHYKKEHASQKIKRAKRKPFNKMIIKLHRSRMTKTSLANSHKYSRAKSKKLVKGNIKQVLKTNEALMGTTTGVVKNAATIGSVVVPVQYQLRKRMVVKQHARRVGGRPKTVMKRNRPKARVR
ncbi:hypothetical protein B0I73DRAFT_136073 [Yarrowia lipolytica]|nr:hypothetical protein BKA90DRAFT_133903 [Yarrowia lipolytica]QNP99654.1 Hypothetical protein YALI2_E00970g [Yarrowia lipolytica]RDW37090.1 hypothetical protein B0I73DRAFT_136073 [Yarrowia lipolytica]RMI99967.1 hypothetical protein BD777DRAFT_122567 [Yarrowia lipolytica]